MQEKLEWSVDWWETRKSINAPATYAQKEFLRKCGIEPIVFNAMTLYEAAAEISRRFRRRGFTEIGAKRALTRIESMEPCGRYNYPITWTRMGVWWNG